MSAPHKGCSNGCSHGLLSRFHHSSSRVDGSGAVLAAVALLLAIAVVLASCGGSGSSAAEDLIDRAGSAEDGGNTDDPSTQSTLGKDGTAASEHDRNNEDADADAADGGATGDDDGDAGEDGDAGLSQDDAGAAGSSGNQEGQDDKAPEGEPSGEGDQGGEGDGATDGDAATGDAHTATGNDDETGNEAGAEGETPPDLLAAAEPVAIALDPGLTPQDATVEAVVGEPVVVENNDPCRSLTRDDVVVRCGVAGRLVWEVVAPVSGPGTTVTVYRVIGGDEAELLEPVLSAVDQFDRAWESVGVQTVDLSGDEVPEVLLGFRTAGSGNFLEVDVVANDGQVVLHRSLHHGEALYFSGVYADYAAVSDPDEPNCCPSEFTFETLRYSEGRWSLSDSTVVDADQVLSGLF